MTRPTLETALSALCEKRDRQREAITVNAWSATEEEREKAQEELERISAAIIEIEEALKEGDANS
jgi:hypothetical protein